MGKCKIFLKKSLVLKMTKEYFATFVRILVKAFCHILLSLLIFNYCQSCALQLAVFFEKFEVFS